MPLLKRRLKAIGLKRVPRLFWSITSKMHTILSPIWMDVYCHSSAAMDGGCSTQQRRFGSTETRSQNYTRTYSFDDSTGRSDCVVTTADAVYIFEFKLTGNGTAEDAIAQIRKQNYAAQYRAEGKKIVLIGASFDEDTRTIHEWTVDNG